MRIGLFGGTFDPIHFGHLRAALEVKEGFDLDQIFLIPAASPPHKTRSDVTDAADRLEMVELAVADNSVFTVSDVELKRSGPSYSIDTINHFKESAPKDSEIFFISGLDAFLEIDTWKSYSGLLKQIAFIVIARPILDCEDHSSRWKRLEDFLRSKISDKYEFSSSISGFEHSEAQPIYTFDVTSLDISSTRIRELVKKRRSIEFLVPEKVEYYIKSRGLYL
jgi:nicotinate-nucleotide adenylyltransferase